MIFEYLGVIMNCSSMSKYKLLICLEGLAVGILNSCTELYQLVVTPEVKSRCYNAGLACSKMYILFFNF